MVPVRSNVSIRMEAQGNVVFSVKGLDYLFEPMWCQITEKQLKQAAI